MMTGAVVLKLVNALAMVGTGIWAMDIMWRPDVYADKFYMKPVVKLATKTSKLLKLSKEGDKSGSNTKH